jgi:hypothetical protein
MRVFGASHAQRTDGFVRTQEISEDAGRQGEVVAAAGGEEARVADPQDVQLGRRTPNRPEHDPIVGELEDAALPIRLDGSTKKIRWPASAPSSFVEACLAARRIYMYPALP